jgi:cytochrome P450
MSAISNILQTSIAGLVDIYPVLRYLPDWMMPIVGRAKTVCQNQEKFQLSLWNETKDRHAKGNAMPCFTLDMIRAQKEEGFSDVFGADLAGGSIAAGTETTANTLYGFIQAMVLFPAVQQKAQEELDRVVGDRLPTIEDMPNLPYIGLCVKESLRWFPTGITGVVPHCAREDYEYMGWKIPKGAELVNNVYTIHYDPALYPNPEQFDPERFNNDSSGKSQDPKIRKRSRDYFTFGAGRRICPGMHLAEISLHLAVARLLWSFKISPSLDKETGKPILPDPTKYTQGVVCKPEKYEATILPRSAQRADIVRCAWKGAQESLDENMQWREIPSGMKFSNV